MGLLTIVTALNYCELGAAIPLAGWQRRLGAGLNHGFEIFEILQKRSLGSALEKHTHRYRHQLPHEGLSLPPKSILRM